MGGSADAAHGSREQRRRRHGKVDRSELAVSGMTNRDIAASLFISPKTVEVNLSRIYRKLNVRSRMELSRVWEPGSGATA